MLDKYCWSKITLIGYEQEHSERTPKLTTAPALSTPCPTRARKPMELSRYTASHFLLLPKKTQNNPVNATQSNVEPPAVAELYDSDIALSRRREPTYIIAQPIQ
jgi:hypothetical protein